MNKHRIMFDLEGMSNCCGMMTISNFHQEVEYAWSRDTVEVFKDHRIVFSRFEEDLFEAFFDHIENDANYGGGGYLLACTLVEKYKDLNEQQFPELAAYLLQSGWEIKNTWTNRNTGNICALYTRFLTDDEISAAEPEREEEEDEEASW